MNDIKSKLPLKKSDSENDLVDDELQEDDEKTDPGESDKTGITQIEDLTEENTNVGIKAKKKSHILKIIIGIGLLVLLFGEQIFPPEEPVSVPAKVSKKKTGPTPKEPAETPAPTVETAPEAAAPVETPEPAVETAPEEAAPVETTEPAVETAPEAVTTVETTEPAVETTPEEAAPVETPSDFPSVSEDTVDEGIPVTPSEESLTEKILEDLESQVREKAPKEVKKEYVAPPDYEYVGRGLVYNCVGKHWACVDAPSYKKCEDNNSSTKYLDKRIECHPYNVYQSNKGCGFIQSRMISSNAKTDFCNGN